MLRSDLVEAAIASRIVTSSPRADERRLATMLASKGGSSVRAIVFFGSRKTQAQPDPYSAYDFFVVTNEYLGFYRSLERAGLLRRSPRLFAALNIVLPPNQISVVDEKEGIKVWLKCSVLTTSAFLRETSAKRHDQFCAGRLFQETEIVYFADEAVRKAIVEGIMNAHLVTFDWVRPFLPSRFDWEVYARTLLKVSLGQEIRPEAPERADELFRAQEGYLSGIYCVLLQELCRAGELVEVPGGYALSQPASFLERIGTRLNLSWSLVRATARWAKYIVTFEGWLEYIVHKVERRTGSEIVLTNREKRWPVIFLWPRLIRFLRQRGV